MFPLHGTDLAPYLFIIIYFILASVAAFACLDN